MKPANIQHIGSELAIAWDDSTESYIPLARMRRGCPCAYCSGEKDLMGRTHKGPELPLSPAAFELKGFEPVGAYAIRITWGDGHSSGIYSFEYLKKLGENA